MLRSQERELTAWIASPRRKPLVLRGARQVGKSTIVRRFAARSGLTLHEVNLERQPHLRAAFASMDVHRILAEVELVARKGPVTDAGGLLFLDEIQAIPAAISALRYLYEELPELPVIAAGSLLEFALENTRFSMPVGRIAYLFMGPMTFEETLVAQGDDDLITWLQTWTPGQDVPLTAHRRLLERFRTYLVVGGMPEAVAHQIASDGVGAHHETQDAILETYRDDFPKYRGTGNADLLLRTYDYLQRHIGEKVKYASIDRGAQARSVRRAIELLFKARVAFPVRRTSAAGLPLGAGLDPRVYKSYFLDCGLVARASGITWIDDATLQSAAFINRGPLAEQFIAQHLWSEHPRGRRPELWYWLREGRSDNAEIDFLLEFGGTVVPVEVKAGKSGSMKSLFQFAARKGIDVALRFDLNPPSVAVVRHAMPQTPVSFRLLSLPLYMVGQAKRLLNRA